MIRQQVGDVLEIHYENNWYYLTVLSKIVMFGGNIVFAYHNDGKKKSLEQVKEINKGFNICTDLLLVKRKGLVTRLGKIENIEGLFKTKFMKACFETRKGEKAKRWFIYKIDNLRNHIAVTKRLSSKYKYAMDSGTYSFDLVAKKILDRYTPDQNEHI